MFPLVIFLKTEIKACFFAMLFDQVNLMKEETDKLLFDSTSCLGESFLACAQLFFPEHPVII